MSGETEESGEKNAELGMGRRNFLRISGLVAASGMTGFAGCLGGPTPQSEKSPAPGPGSTTPSSYDWESATFDSYWYSLYNMSTTVALSGNGVMFPHNDEQRAAFEKRMPAILKHSDVERPPVKNPNLNIAPFTEGDPGFTQKPVLSSGDGRPDASTLEWDMAKSSGVVSPASLAWTQLKGVTWAKNFEAHFDLLPPNIAPKFRAQLLATLAQLGLKAGLIDGGPAGNGALTRGETMELAPGFRPAEGRQLEGEAGLRQYTSTIWFLSELLDLAENGWFGYRNPEPLIPAEKVRKLTDGVAGEALDRFDADSVASGATRDIGETLSSLAWYGTVADGAAAERAKTFTDGLAAKAMELSKGNGRLETDGNLAAAQGSVAQGLVWASELDGTDPTGFAKEVAGYLLDDLWNPEPGYFSSGEGTLHRYTARDAADVTGGLNAADAELGLDIREKFPKFFDQTFNRGSLQRAERAPSRDADATHPLPLPPKAGGKYGQAAVYNAEVEYDAERKNWRVIDERFRTSQALYLSNQDVWIGRWADDPFPGRGIPGSASPPE